MAKSNAVRGWVVYQGLSMINRAPIVAILTARTSNAKTGDMMQLWILPADALPSQAVKSGADESVCGSCSLRGIMARAEASRKARRARRSKVRMAYSTAGRACYVNTGHAPDAVYRAWTRGRYPIADASTLQAIAGRMVRLGAYGDPAALPVGVVRALIAPAKGWTGYTHQWRNGSRHVQAFRGILMASTENVAGTDDAHAMGWRTFRVRRASDPVRPGEIVCPAAPEGQYRRSCASCGACNGADRPGKVSVVIIGHGGIGVMPNVGRTLDALAG